MTKVPYPTRTWPATWYFFQHLTWPDIEKPYPLGTALGTILFRCADGWTHNAQTDGCDRCDDVCAKRDGKLGKDDYKNQTQGQGQGQGQCTYECGSWPNGGGCTVCSNIIFPLELLLDTFHEKSLSDQRTIRNIWMHHPLQRSRISLLQLPKVRQFANFLNLLQLKHRAWPRLDAW